MKDKTQKQEESITGIYEKLKSQAGRPKKNLTFEELKPLVEAMIKGQSMAEFTKEQGGKLKYVTVIQRRAVALDFINPDNKKRQLTPEDEAWLKDAYKRLGAN